MLSRVTPAARKEHFLAALWRLAKHVPTSDTVRMYEQYVALKTENVQRFDDLLEALKIEVGGKIVNRLLAETTVLVRTDVYASYTYEGWERY